MLRCARVCLTLVHTLHVRLRACVVLRWPNFTLRCALLSFFGDQTSRYAARFCLSSAYKTSCCLARFCWSPVNTLHAALRASAVLRWKRFMFCFARALYFSDQTSRCVAHFCCTSVNTLHVTLRASAVLQWTLFMLRCVRVFNSVKALHVTLRGCVLIRWTRFMLRCARVF